MAPETKERMSLLCGRPIRGTLDMTPVETAAALDAGTKTLVRLGELEAEVSALRRGMVPIPVLKARSAFTGREIEGVYFYAAVEPVVSTPEPTEGARQLMWGLNHTTNATIASTPTTNHTRLLKFGMDGGVPSPRPL